MYQSVCIALHDVRFLTNIFASLNFNCNQNLKLWSVVVTRYEVNKITAQVEKAVGLYTGIEPVTHRLIADCSTN